MSPAVTHAPEADGPEASDREAPATHRTLGAFLFVSSLIALYASVTLMLDKLRLLEAEADGSAVTLGCDLNPWVSCSGVIASDQATAILGVPNPLWGVMGYTAMAAFGAMLWSGRKLPTWVWAGMQIGALAGIVMVTWLQYEAIYDIQRLCPWCMVVWACMIPMFVLITARNLNWQPLKDWTGLVISLWFLAVAGAIWLQFGSKIFGV